MATGGSLASVQPVAGGGPRIAIATMTGCDWNKNLKNYSLRSEMAVKNL